MTPEMITTITSMLAVLTVTGGMFAWLHRHMDKRFDQQDARWDARFERVEARLEMLEAELTGVKVAIARLEGPHPRIITAR